MGAHRQPQLHRQHNINAGTLFIGGGGTTGSVVSSIFNNFGTLGFNRSNSLTYAGTIVGTGAVNQVGAGTTTLTGNNSYTGATTISADRKSTRLNSSH